MYNNIKEYRIVVSLQECSPLPSKTEKTKNESFACKNGQTGKLRYCEIAMYGTIFRKNYINWREPGFENSLVLRFYFFVTFKKFWTLKSSLGNIHFFWDVSIHCNMKFAPRELRVNLTSVSGTCQATCTSGGRKRMNFRRLRRQRQR